MPIKVNRTRIAFLTLSIAFGSAMASDKYIKSANKALSGHNTKTLTGKSVEECKKACSNEKGFQCKSFDYHKNKNICDLSDTSAKDVSGGLKSNYPGNPYDHYARVVSNPVGYISIRHDFGDVKPVYWGGKQKGFASLEFPFTLSSDSSAIQGTFWAFDFSFGASSNSLPANHVNYKNSDQGGYIGLQAGGNYGNQVKDIAIFSIFWAERFVAGANAKCSQSNEIWYADDNPWSPQITDVKNTDQSRKIAGGPYTSCRLPVPLKKGGHYKLKINEIADARKPDDPEWWGAWFIDTDTNKEHYIGKIQVPGSWKWLNSSVGGFIEHFKSMPNDCGSIPGSAASYDQALADNAKYRSKLAMSVYGDCEAAIKSRATISCQDGKKCSVNIK